MTPTERDNAVLTDRTTAVKPLGVEGCLTQNFQLSPATQLQVENPKVLQVGAASLTSANKHELVNQTGSVVGSSKGNRLTENLNK